MWGVGQLLYSSQITCACTPSPGLPPSATAAVVSVIKQATCTAALWGTSRVHDRSHCITTKRILPRQKRIANLLTCVSFYRPSCLHIAHLQCLLTTEMLLDWDMKA